MKKLIKSNSREPSKGSHLDRKAVTAASVSAGTTYYRITLKELTDAFSEQNLWLQKCIEERGFNAIDFDHSLYGSRFDIGEKDVMYLCVTDGYDIEVNGEMVDPEDALDYHNPAPGGDLYQYVKPSTPEIILKNISEYEFKDPDFTQWAVSLLRHYDFIDLMKAAQEHWFND